MGLSGVKGDGAQKQIGRGTWETPRAAGGNSGNDEAKDITLRAARKGVGQAHSSEEAGNDRGAKGSDSKHAESEGESAAWGKPPATELRTAAHERRATGANALD